MGYYATAARRMASGRNAVLGSVARLGGAALSNRGLAIAALLGCVLLASGPWLRPPVSRDFRGWQIPWSGAGDSFTPRIAAETPRPWSWGSIAVPLIAISAGGAAVALLRPRWTPSAFGLLLAMSLPATAAVLWNHPAMIEFFEAEVRGRIALRTVFRSESRDLLVGDSPDRLAERWGKNTKAELLPATHPLETPFRYLVYGPWLVVVSAAGVALTTVGGWPTRLGRAAAWGAVGVIVAAAATGPRWLAEYHFAEAAEHESANRLAAADAALDRARDAMPEFASTRRYWLDKGRIAYRQNEPGRFRAFFEAHQLGLANRYLEARSVLGERVKQDGGETVERELLAEFVSSLAERDGRRGAFASSEDLWEEAAELVPWTPVYWIGGAATALWGDPGRADEVARLRLSRIDQVGDRVLNSDLASLVGDAYFHTGDFKDARAMYARSLDNFNLPKQVNLRAQRGRLGM